MDVTAQDDIHTGFRPSTYGGITAVRDIVLLRGSGHCNRLMHHDDAQLLRGCGAHCVGDAQALLTRDLPIDMAIAPRRLHPQNETIWSTPGGLQVSTEDS